MVRFRIRTNWTNSVSRTHEFELDDLADAATRDRLKWAFSDPERLRPGETRQSLTERVAASFASVAQALRERGHDPQAVAHFVNRLVFCMFADDVGLLPDHMFTRMLRHALPAPARFGELAGELFRAMASGGRVGFETVAWFNGSLFNDDTTLPLERTDIETVLAASDLDWSEIDPSILGTLFERGLDPNKRAQLGAHYTDRDKIMLLVEPVVVRPLLAEWDAEKTEITAELERAEAARSRPARTKRLNEAERRYRAFLNRLRGFTVLDPACGSGNFLYLALQALKDLEHRVQLEAEALSFQRAFPEIGPAKAGRSRPGLLLVLTARRGGIGVDLTRVSRLPENAGVAFMGDTKGGAFDVTGDQAREWLRLPANPNGRTNADVLKPWVNGMNLTRRPAGKWIVDFGWTMSVSSRSNSASAAKMPNTRRPAAVVVSICAPSPASTRRPSPRADRSCTVLTRWARLRPRRSSFQTTSTSPFRRARRLVAAT